MAMMPAVIFDFGAQPAGGPSVIWKRGEKSPPGSNIPPVGAGVGPPGAT